MRRLGRLRPYHRLFIHPGVQDIAGQVEIGWSEATGQGLAIAFRSEPDPPEAGDNTFEVTVKQPDGSPVTDASVMAVFSMPAMPSMNMPAMRSTATLSHEASGRYRGTGQLLMGGTWNVTVVVARGLEQLGSKKFSVIAK